MDFRHTSQDKVLVSSGDTETCDEPTSSLTGKPRGLAKEFRPGQQLRRLVLAGLARWLVTAAIIGCLYAIIVWFSSQPILSKAGKRAFNTLITGFSIALGLSVVSSLKAMALDLRWWILTWKRWTVQELDLVMHAESLTHLFKLGLTSSHIGIRLAVGLWILVNIAAQISVATLGLTYSVDTADNTALMKDGLVAVPNMTSIPTGRIVRSKSTDLGALQFIANSFGTVALAMSVSSIDNLPKPGSVFSPKNTDVMFFADNNWTFVFYDTSAEADLSQPESAGSPLSVATNRSVNSTAVCRSWPVVQGGNGTELNITINAGPGNTASIIPIPVAGGVDQTTFMTRTDGLADCGLGCTQVTAFEASPTASWYYDCNVTVGDVVNAVRKEHEIGPSLRNLASGAIALQGYGTSSLAIDRTTQYQIYPAESAYGNPVDGKDGAMAMLMARFAISVIAVTASSSPAYTIPGKAPQQGLTLNVTSWRFVHIILSLAAGVQLILTLVVALFANRVIVRDNSPLASARLLRPIVDRLGPGGSIATGTEIAREFGDDKKVVYCVERSENSGCYQVQLSERKKARLFPTGWYD